MKKLSIFFLIVCFCISCFTSRYAVCNTRFNKTRENVRVEFKLLKSIYKTKKEVVKIDNLDIGCGISTSFYYSNMFKDSSLLYCISAIMFEENYNPNYVNIKQKGDAIYKYRFNKIKFEEFGVVDTFDLSGIDSSGMYWKDIYLQCSFDNIGFLPISIGYKKVSLANKCFFDECLKSFIIEIKSKKKYGVF